MEADEEKEVERKSSALAVMNLRFQWGHFQCGPGRTVKARDKDLRTLA